MTQLRSLVFALVALAILVGCAAPAPAAPSEPAPAVPAATPTVEVMPTPLPPEVELTAAELAVRGRRVYSRRCVVCHEESFAGSLDKALDRFDTAASLFAYMRDLMPQDAPGSLPADDYLAVLAKVLVENNVLAEDAILDPNNLQQIPLR